MYKRQILINISLIKWWYGSNKLLLGLSVSFTIFSQTKNSVYIICCHLMLQFCYGNWEKWC